MITFRQKGGFSNTIKFLNKAKNLDKLKKLDTYAKLGVDALASNTPVNTGLTADSWTYKIENKDGYTSISFNNTNVVNGVNIAIILQYGHATKNGGYVQGLDYINPAIKPIFEKIAEDIWKEVIKDA